MVAGPARESRAEPSWLRAALVLPQPKVPAETGAAVLFERTEIKLGAHLRAEIHETRATRILRSIGLDHAKYHVLLRPGAKLKSLHVWSLGPQGRRSGA